MDYAADLPRLLIAIAMVVPVTAWIVLSIHWMLMGDLDVRAGFTAILVAIALMPLAIWPPHPAVPGIIFVMMLATLAFFPFARTQLMARLHRVIDIEELQKAHAAFAQRPDNVASRLAIARALHVHGLLAPAIAIAEQALSTLPNERDPVSNRSTRDLFANEDRALSKWKQEAHGSDLCAKIQCPGCKSMNDPAAIICSGCQGPYLLYIARAGLDKDKFTTRLVVGWTIIAVVIVACSYIALNIEGAARSILIMLIVLAAGLGLVLIFGSRSLTWGR